MKILKFIARKKSTGEERLFSFDDLYGYEGEVNGVFLELIDGSDLSESGNWKISNNSGYQHKGMNPDIEIFLVENEPDSLDVPNAETIATMEEAIKLAHDPNAKTFTSVEELFEDIESDE